MCKRETRRKKYSPLLTSSNTQLRDARAIKEGETNSQKPSSNYQLRLKQEGKRKEKIFAEAIFKLRIAFKAREKQEGI